MQVEKFTQTEALIESCADQCSSSSSRPVWQAEPPNDVRAGSKEYYKKLYEAQLEISRKQAELPVSPEDLGIVNVPKIESEEKDNLCNSGSWQYGRKEDLRTYRGITQGGRKKQCSESREENEKRRIR